MLHTHKQKQTAMMTKLKLTRGIKDVVLIWSFSVFLPLFLIAGQIVAFTIGHGYCHLI